MAYVPSLGGSRFLTDPQSIIAYTLTKFTRNIKDAVPLLEDSIISLPWLISQYGKEPQVLADRIQSDLQSAFSRIFGTEREITVSTDYTVSDNGTCDISISIVFYKLSGEIDQLGTSIQLNKDGRLVTPDTTLNFNGTVI